MIPQKHFYMIRHGETESNVADVCAGFLDSPLTAKGRGEAATAAKIVEGLSIPPTVIFHSHLSRARDTAAIINHNLKLPMHEDARVAERNFGEWHGIAMSELAQRRAAGQQPPGGETDDEFHTRVQRGISDILMKNAAPVLIASHGGAFRAINVALGIEIRNVKNCELFEFMPSGMGWRITKYTANGAEIIG